MSRLTEAAATLKGARSDALAISAAVGALVVMIHDAETLADHGYLMTGNNESPMKDIGSATLGDAAKALKQARERMAQIMEDLGDYFNAHDACSKSMEKLTTPVYEMFQKRAQGISFDD